MVICLVLVALVGSTNDDVIFKDSFENHAPEITSLPATTALVNVLYTCDVVATDIDGDLLQYELVVSPDNMSIGEFSGEIRWTPDQLGVFAVEFLVSDGKGGATFQQWDINVQDELDSDLDGLSDADELLIGTDPLDADTDDDGLEDGEEVNWYDTNPLDTDTDDDGLSDGDEIKVYFTQPNNADTDNDTYRDGEEIDYGTDPLDDTDFPVNTPPADPADVAPEIDPTIETTVFDSTEFLYRGLHRVQTGVENGVIEPTQVAVIRGKVTSRDGAPLSGVLVSVLHHPEFGETISRADGMYDMVVNGGGYLTVSYARDGYLPAQRQVEAEWQSWVRAPDVALIPMDSKQTIIDLTQPGMQVARGSVVTDDRGVRQNTVVFPEGTVAEMVFADGSTQAIGTITVSATEYSVGEGGENAMPAQLPPGIGYTYCAELTVAEAVDAGAQQLKFNQPVPNYLENFMGFPVGAEVPAYYYDKIKGHWILTPPGRVIEIVGVNGGLADLDTDGDGLANDAPTLAALGITEAERQQLAGLYVTGDSIWRVQLEHFSTIDYNYSYPYPPSAYPQTPNPQLLQPEEDNCEESTASTIACQSQSLGEAVPIVGTPFSLHYTSSRAPGTISSRHLSIPVAGQSCQETRVWINFAGRQILETLPCDGEDRVVEFTWDGLDAYGREAGSAAVEVGLAYVYPALRLARWWNEAAGEWAETYQPVPHLLDVLVSERWKGLFINPDERRFGFGGWSINEQHRYESVPRTLNYGDGLRRSSDAIGQIIKKLFLYDGVRFYGFDVGPDATTYLADYKNHKVMALGANGSFYRTFAGKYSPTFPVFNGDGILATEAYLRFPRDVAMGPKGDIYIADSGFSRVRRVDRDGLIWTVAGNGVSDEPCEGCLATESPLSGIMKIDVGSDGTLYIARTRTSGDQVLRVGTDGILSEIYAGGLFYVNGLGHRTQITDLAVGPENSVYISQYSCFGGACPDPLTHTVLRVWPTGDVDVIAGNGTDGFSGDGGPAVDAQLTSPNGIALGDDQSVYISDGGNRRIRKVSPDGVIRTVAGCDSTIPDCLYTMDYGLFSTVTSLISSAISSGPDGLYIISNGTTGVLKIDPPLPGLTEGEIMLPDASGKRVYFFEGSGRHLRTVNSLTGAVIYRFSYSDDGLLTQIRDGDGNVTIIERDPEGVPTAIISPYGQRTNLALDANGYLATVTNPASEAWQFGYTDDGLLTTATDPNENTSTYTYDVSGLLVHTLDAAGGSHTLARTEFDNSYEVTRKTGLGHTTTYRVEQLPTGDKRWLNTVPNGLSIESLFKTDGSQTTTSPDGTVVRIVQGPDPRFGMQSPVVESLDIATPGGLTQVITMSRTATLSNPGDLLSLISKTDTMVVNGKTLTRSFDTATGRITTTTPTGRQLTEMLDGQGRIVSRELAGLAPMFYEYDLQGRLSDITFRSGGTARARTISYDTDGYVATVSDPLLRTTSLEYDDAGRLSRQVTPDSREILLGYDNGGNLTSVAPPGRPAHLFAYTPVNLMEEYVPPDGDTSGGAGPWDTTWSFDHDRQRDQVVQPDDVTISFGYDTAGRLQQLTTDRGVSSFSYDPLHGYVSSMSTPEGNTLSFTYDASLITDFAWTGEVVGSIVQEYNNHFRIISRSINGGAATAFAYDDDGLLTNSGALSLSRDAGNGLITGSTLGNVSGSLTYNEFGEIETYVASYDATPQYSEQLTRDKQGRIIERTETISGAAHVYEYIYDLAGRLEEVKIDSSTVSAYTYDTNGNRLSHNGVAGSYDDQDRLLQYGNIEYMYAASGNLETRTDISLSQTTSYDYDAYGNLMEAMLSDGTVVEYVVDALNRRIGKKVDGTLVRAWLYKDGLNPVAELDGAGAVLSIFIYASKRNVPDFMLKGGNTYRVVADHLGSPRMVIDTATGIVEQQMEFDEFGNVLQDSNPGFQPFGFAGGLYDPDTQLVRFGARDYDPSIGRWTARDPILFDGRHLNLYGYTANDPVNFIDPGGLRMSWSDLSGLITTAIDYWGELAGYEQQAEQAAQVAVDMHGHLTNTSVPLAEQGAGVLGCGLRAGSSVAGSFLPWVGESAGQIGEMAAGTLDNGINAVQEFLESWHPRMSAGQAGQDTAQEVTITRRFSQ